MPICAGTKGLTTIRLALRVLVTSCDSKPDVTSPSPVARSSAPLASTQDSCESLDTLAIGVVIRIGPPPANFYHASLMNIAARPFTWIMGSITTTDEAKTENIGKADGRASRSLPTTSCFRSGKAPGRYCTSASRCAPSTTRSWACAC
jgi:hypothetical protein